MSKKKMSIEVACNLMESSLNNNHKEFRYYRISDKGAPIAIIIDKQKNCRILSEDQACLYLGSLSRKLANEQVEAIESNESSFSNVDILFATHSTSKVYFKSLGLRNDLIVKGKIKPFAFKSEDCLTFCRLPFDPSDTEFLTPSFNSFIDNFTNADAIKMWIGSLFIENSDRSQYLWLYGPGGNGKSTLAKIIRSVFGDFVKSEQTPKADDKYWTSGLIGVRLIVIDDCNNFGFVKTGLFKSVTGSGRVRVEQKYGNPYDADLDCKFLFTSNETPLISSDPSDQRRVIFSSAKNTEKFDYDAMFEENLVKELPMFISNCIRLYKIHCNDGRPIPTDKAEAEQLSDLFDEQVEAFLDRLFEYDENGLVPISEFRNHVDISKINARNIYSYLAKKGVSRASTWLPEKGQTTKVLKGIKLKVFQGGF